MSRRLKIPSNFKIRNTDCDTCIPQRNIRIFEDLQKRIEMLEALGGILANDSLQDLTINNLSEENKNQDLDLSDIYTKIENINQTLQNLQSQITNNLQNLQAQITNILTGQTQINNILDGIDLQPIIEQLAEQLSYIQNNSQDLTDHTQTLSQHNNTLVEHTGVLDTHSTQLVEHEEINTLQTGILDMTFG